MLPEIVAALSATKSTMSMAKALKSIDDRVERNQIIYEITEKLIEIQQTTLETQEHLLKISEDNKKLKEELEELKSSKADFDNYFLNELPAGGKVYTKKPSTLLGEPTHHICPDCISEKRKSILQGSHTLFCQVCKFQTKATERPTPKVKTRARRWDTL